MAGSLKKIEFELKWIVERRQLTFVQHSQVLQLLPVLYVPA